MSKCTGLDFWFEKFLLCQNYIEKFARNLKFILLKTGTRMNEVDKRYFSLIRKQTVENILNFYVLTSFYGTTYCRVMVYIYSPQPAMELKFLIAKVEILLILLVSIMMHYFIFLVQKWYRICSQMDVLSAPVTSKKGTFLGWKFAHILLHSIGW